MARKRKTDVNELTEQETFELFIEAIGNLSTERILEGLRDALSEDVLTMISDELEE
jgi:hypothetical protein